MASQPSPGMAHAGKAGNSLAAGLAEEIGALVPALPTDDPLRGVLWLVTLMLAFGVLSLFGIMIYFADEQDMTTVHASIAAVRSGLEERQQEVAQKVRDVAWSDEALAHLVTTLDVAWAEAAIGPAQVEENSIAASFVVDGEDHTAIAFLHGRPARVDAFDMLSGGLGELLGYSRASPRRALRAAAGYLMFEGSPHLVVASAIAAGPRSAFAPGSVAKSVIVFVRPLDTAFLTRLGIILHLDDLRLANDKEANLPATLNLTSPNGTPIGALTWSPDLPAHEFVTGAGPVAAGVVAIMVVLFGLFLRRSRRIGIILARQAKIIEQVHDGVILTDPFGIIKGWNAGAERMFGYQSAEVIGRSAAAILVDPDVNARIGEIVRSFDRGVQHADLDVVMRRKNGEQFPVQLLLSPLRNASGGVTGTIGYHLDISERKKLEDKLERLAIVDELTGAYNRRHLLSQAPIEIERARRFKRALSFLFIDLDHFKAVNDRFGHIFGDMVLAMFTQTCRGDLRPTDMLVRYGGEEFVIMMPETSQEQAVAAAMRLSDHVKETWFSKDPPYRGLTISVGATSLRDTDRGIDSVLERADKAVYRAKALGRDRIELAA